MIYLASPYSHADADVREERFNEAVRHAAIYWQRGEVVFSPIAHSHPIALHGISGEWEQWAEFDEAIIRACSLVRVLMLDGWLLSRGIKAEIEIAAVWDIPVEYAKPLLGDT